MRSAHSRSAHANPSTERLRRVHDHPSPTPRTPEHDVLRPRPRRHPAPRDRRRHRPRLVRARRRRDRLPRAARRRRRARPPSRLDRPPPPRRGDHRHRRRPAACCGCAARTAPPARSACRRWPTTPIEVFDRLGDHAGVVDLGVGWARVSRKQDPEQAPRVRRRAPPASRSASATSSRASRARHVNVRQPVGSTAGPLSHQVLLADHRQHRAAVPRAWSRPTRSASTCPAPLYWVLVGVAGR